MPFKKGKASASAIGLKIDGEFCFGRHIVAEKFNHFFTTVASKLVEKLPKLLIHLENNLWKFFIV